MLATIFVSQAFEFTKPVLLLFLPTILFPYTFNHAYYGSEVNLLFLNFAQIVFGSQVSHFLLC